MKETFYFSHDYNAQHDEKIIKLMSVLGWEGYGLYWGIIEKLYDADGYLNLDYNCLAFGMRTQCDTLKSVVEDYGLFKINDGKFYSQSALNRLEFRKEKSVKAKQSANIRWNNANALRTQCDANALKESKVKESKFINQNNLISYSELVKPYKDFTRVKCKDGCIALRRFGAWVDDKNPEVKMDLSFYKELQ